MNEPSEKPSTGTPTRIDLLTVSAIAIVVFFLCCLTHEAIGHGGAATIQGFQVTNVTNAYCRSVGAEGIQRRIIAAGGMVANAALALLATLAGRSMRGRADHGATRYFLWLLTYMNLFSIAGYLATFSMLKLGDVHQIVRGLPMEWPLRIGLTIGGFALIFWVFVCASRSLEVFAGYGPDRIKRGVTLTLTPYLVGGSVNVAASLLGVGTTSLAVVLISAIGSTFGGNFPMLWTPQMMRRRDDVSITPVTPTRSVPWIISGGIFLMLYLILGYGISFA